MSGNKFRIGFGKKKAKGKGIFSRIESALQLENYFEEGFPVAHLPKIAFVMILGIFYISNTHYAEKAIRQIQRLRAEVEDLRADYTTRKADLMFAGKQSEVARKVKPLGLKESLDPPFKIVVRKGEH